ncbi:MAG: hypothetical protein V4492_03955 [Chlamydiota bacterium]
MSASMSTPSVLSTQSSTGEIFQASPSQVQAEVSEGMPECDIHQLLLSSRTLISGKTHAEYQQILDNLWQSVQRGETTPPCISFEINQTTDTHFQIPPEMLLSCRFDAVSEYNKFSIHFEAHTPNYPLAKLCHLSKHRFLEYHASAHEQIQLQMRELLDQLPATVRNAFCGDIYKHRNEHSKGMKDYWQNHDNFVFGEVYLTDFFRSSLATQSSMIIGDLPSKRERYFIAPAIERYISGQVSALQSDPVRFETFINLVKEADKYQEVTSSLEDVKGNLVKWADALVAFERAEKRFIEGQSSTIHLSIMGNLEELLAKEAADKEAADKEKGTSSWCTIA